MQVKTLMGLLETCDPEALVVMASDGEGNSYSPLADFTDGHYVADTTYSGWFMSGKEEYEEEEEYEKDLADSVPAVLLYPTH
jgi:hypothetical protein